LFLQLETDIYPISDDTDICTSLFIVVSLTRKDFASWKFLIGFVSLSALGCLRNPAKYRKGLRTRSREDNLAKGPFYALIL
jgi:hypothetical protein